MECLTDDAAGTEHDSNARHIASHIISGGRHERDATAGEGEDIPLDGSAQPEDPTAISYEALAANDAIFLYLETPSTPMNVGNVSIFEPGPFFDDNGVFRIDDVRSAIESRLHLVPRYRKKLMEVPFTLGHPVLVDDSQFDISYHVRLTALPRPGTEQQLKTLVAQIHETMLDRGKPLWELWFIEGLESGHVALVQKSHHCLIDGVATVDVMTVLFDREPDARIPEPPRWKPRPAPDPIGLVNERLAGQIQSAYASFFGSGTWSATQWSPERWQELTDALATLARVGPPPLVSLNRPVGRSRRFEFVRTSLAEIKKTKYLMKATVNDVVLAAVAGGLHDLFAARGEVVTGGHVNAFVPVSLRDETTRHQWANRVSGIIVPLPVADIDPVTRLREIVETTKDLKERVRAVGADFLTGLSDFAPPTLLALGARQSISQLPFINLTVTNVPGPQTALYFMGARLLEFDPWAIVAQNMTVSVAIVSYDGRVSIGICGDRDATTDLPVLARGIERALGDLSAAARTAS